MSIPTPNLRLPAALVLSVALAAPAWSQSHSQQFGDYTVQSSSVNSMNLSAQSAREHGIERRQGVAVLNVVVHKETGGKRLTVPAQVEARITGLAGVMNDVTMRETRGEGRVAYTGTYPVLPRQVVDITVSARPEGASEPLKMTYRERMWADVSAQ